MSANLSSIINQRTKPGTTEPREFVTRPLTGRKRPPLILVAGGDKVGKSYALAAASADPAVARMTVLEVGGDRGALDEYGQIDGAAVEIIEHNGTWGDITEAIAGAVDRAPDPSGYNVLAIDNATSLWATLSREAQRGGRDLGPGGWSSVNATWDDFLALLRQHPGPVVLIARVDGDALVDDTVGKVRTQKDLAYECDLVIRATGHREFVLAGARSLALAVADHKGTIPLGDLNLPYIFDQFTQPA